MPDINFGRFPIRSLVFWGLALVIAAGLFTFIRDFTACWRLTSLPGIPPANCMNGPITSPEGFVLARGTAVPTSTPEEPIPEEIAYPTWDGASRINILFVGLRGGDPLKADCPFCTDTLILLTVDPIKKTAYDKLLSQRMGAGEELQKRVTQRSIAEQNFAKAKELSVAGDYYGAIVLLKQAVEFAPDHAEAWFLLGSCQERNPKWRREAAESFQRALSVDPNHVDALISLGDLYRGEGLGSRAQSCYDDVLKIAPDNQQAKSRLTALKKK